MRFLSIAPLIFVSPPAPDLKPWLRPWFGPCGEQMDAERSRRGTFLWPRWTIWGLCPCRYQSQKVASKKSIRSVTQPARPFLKGRSPLIPNNVLEQTRAAVLARAYPYRSLQPERRTRILFDVTNVILTPPWVKSACNSRISLLLK